MIQAGYEDFYYNISGNLIFHFSPMIFFYDEGYLQTSAWQRKNSRPSFGFSHSQLFTMTKKLFFGFISSS